MALVDEGPKFNDFPIKFETFVFTYSKTPKIFLRSIEISENLTISKNLEGSWPPAATPPDMATNGSAEIGRIYGADVLTRRGQSLGLQGWKLTPKS